MFPQVHYKGKDTASQRNFQLCNHHFQLCNEYTKLCNIHPKPRNIPVR